MTRIALLVEELKPYHRARLVALPADWSVTVFSDLPLLTTGQFVVPTHDRFNQIHCNFGTIDYPSARRLVEQQALDAFLVPGWSSLSSLIAMRAAVELGVPVIVMSDSAQQDYPRSRVQEWLKARYLSQVHGALVAGDKHLQYLENLGVEADRIRLGYDVVDNEYFKRCGSLEPDSEMAGYSGVCSEPYVLCCARLIDKKNLSVLLDAFALFLSHTRRTQSALAEWKLIIAGDGPLRQALISQAVGLDIAASVDFVGTFSYQELPSLYHGAQIFVLPSKIEQWGLVINEAMASGVPVIVSNRVGCLDELVIAGKSGLSYPHDDAHALYECLQALSTDSVLRHEIAKQGSLAVGQWDCQRHVRALQELVSLQRRPRRQYSIFLFLTFMSVLIVLYRIFQPRER